jgi:hypothetical protein
MVRPAQALQCFEERRLRDCQERQGSDPVQERAELDIQAHPEDSHYQRACQSESGPGDGGQRLHPDQVLQGSSNDKDYSHEGVGFSFKSQYIPELFVADAYS